jgi:hypothetical protein
MTAMQEIQARKFRQEIQARKIQAWPPLYLIEAACLNCCHHDASMWQFSVRGRSIVTVCKTGSVS